MYLYFLARVVSFEQLTAADSFRKINEQKNQMKSKNKIALPSLKANKLLQLQDQETKTWRKRAILSSNSLATRNCYSVARNELRVLACDEFPISNMLGIRRQKMDWSWRWNVASTSNNRSFVSCLSNRNTPPPHTQYPELPSPDIDISIKKWAVSIDQWILFICL